MTRQSSLRLETDKTYYLPGDTLNGVVHLQLEKSVRVRHLEVRFQGREKVTIPAGRASYSSTNEMSNLSLQFLENQVLVPGELKVPFQFQIPSNALPSFVGRYASVTWKLYAKLDVPWASDLDATVFLRVWTVSSGTPAPVEVANPDPRPKASLTITSNIHRPGESVKGQLVLLDLGNLRSVQVQLLETEEAWARGVMANSHQTNNQLAGPGLWLRREQLVVGSPVEFELLIPPGVATSYRGVWSMVYWNVKATLDIPLSGDVHLYAPFIVSLRQQMAPPVVASPEKVPVLLVAAGASQAVAVVPEPGPVGLAETISPAPSKSASAEGQDDPGSLILKILADGGSKDLLTISSELQQTTGDYIDLNTVMKMCEELVLQGILKRIGTGEYFAQYSLAEPRTILE